MATPTDNVVPLTGNPLIDGLTWGAAWQFTGGSHTLTYSLSLNDNPNGGAWTTALSDAARLALAEWSKVASLSFVESGSGTVYDQSTADIVFLLTGNELQSHLTGLAGLGIPPSPSFTETLLSANGETRATYRQPEGDVALDNYYAGFSYLNPGGLGQLIMLHEIGHALGLKHVDDNHDGRPTFASLGIANLDSNLSTVMSYTDVNGHQFGHDMLGNAATPMPLDILAIQQIYGANTSYHTEDNTYTFYGLSPQMAWTVWDAGGNDTLAAGNVNQYNNVTLDLREGHVSQSPTINGLSMAIAYGAVIENAIGGDGNDSLIGNTADNRLDGGAGSDSMAGGTGNDTYIVDANGDLVTEQAGEGTDTVLSSVTLSLPANVENLTLTGAAAINATGNAADNVLLGNAGRNQLAGGAGNDTLDGAGGLDTMAGGTGDDTYTVSQTSTGSLNTLDLAGDAGSYYVNGQSISVPLPATQLPVILQDRTGDGLIDYLQIFGFSNPSFNLTIGSNQLGQNLIAGSYVNAERASFASIGHAGLDLGFNGFGANQIVGSFTIDAININYGGASPLLQSLALNFEVHPEGQVAATFGTLNYNYTGRAGTPESVVELPNEGYDEVRAGVSYTLADNVEKLTLTGAANIDGSGNGLDNLIVGNGGNNTLSGGGGNDVIDGAGGNDTLDGGAGTDDARFTGNRADHVMTLDSTGIYRVSGVSGVSSLTGIERLVFADHTNFVPTGSLTITGAASEGQTLIASTTLADADGMGSLGYQWQGSVDGTTWNTFGSGSTLFLTQSQVGKQVRLLATYSDGQGNVENVVSAVTAMVAHTNHAPLAGSYRTQAAAAGQPLALDLGQIFSDVDPGDVLHFGASGLPAGLAINPATGQITGTAPGNAGWHPISVTATDDGSLAATLNFALVVAAEPLAAANVLTRGGVALPGVTAHEFISTTPTGSLYGFKNIAVDANPASGLKTLTADLIATGNGSEQQTGFTLHAAGGATLQSFQLTGSVAVGTGWTISESTAAGGYTLEATHGSSTLAGNAVIGKLSLTLPATATGASILDLTDATLGGLHAPGRGIIYTQAEIGPGGELSTPLTDSNLAIALSRGTADYLVNGVTKPVTAADALDALKLSVGLAAAKGNGWRELIAADMNHDGRVTAADALEILKTSVGINTVQPAWVFVPNDATGLTGMTKATVSYQDDWNLSSITTPMANTFTAILVGDVNNSWVIPP